MLLLIDDVMRVVRYPLHDAHRSAITLVAFCVARSAPQPLSPAWMGS